MHKTTVKNQEIPLSTERSSPSFFKTVSHTTKSHKIGDLLVASGLITGKQLHRALAEQKLTNEPLGKILIQQEALTVVQLYRKLAEQWCLKASTVGLTLMMQTMTPSLARADSPDTSAPASITTQFTLAAATLPTAYKPAANHHQYADLFGTQETKSSDISAFKKWTSVMARFEDQMHSPTSNSPRVMLWKAEIQKLKGKSAQEQIAGVNNFLNSVPYIEDTKNYGKTDQWATPIEFLTKGGDCEDFAIAKYASLRALGFSADQLRIAIVQDKIKNVPHAILVVYSGVNNFILDNQDKKVEYASDVSRYRPIFSINSTNWWLHRA